MVVVVDVDGGGGGRRHRPLFLIKKLCPLEEGSQTEEFGTDFNGLSVRQNLRPIRRENRNRLLDFGGKKFKIEIIDSSSWREEIQNRNRLSV